MSTVRWFGPEADVLARVDRYPGAPVGAGLWRRRVEWLPVGVAIVDHGPGRHRARRRVPDPPLETRDAGGQFRGNPDAVISGPIASGPRRGERGEGKHGAPAPGHGVALRTSLLSTVPVSPCTLAPS